MLSKLFKLWRERCRCVRMTSAELPTAQMAQSYLFWLARRYGECPKCGTRCCANSPEYPEPKPITAQQMANFEMMARALRMPAKLQHAALAPSPEANVIREKYGPGKHDNADLNALLDELAAKGPTNE